MFTVKWSRFLQLIRFLTCKCFKANCTATFSSGVCWVE